MREQIKNSSSALLYQFVMVIVGLVIPKLMIQEFGSTVCGLGNSITQFLSYVTLIEGGIGGVTRAALYKTFVEKDNRKISAVIKATDIFFKKVAGLFIVYIIILVVIYPRYINSTFDTLYTGSLICIMAISSFAQYCFGITYSLFLNAAQKNYITNIIEIVTCIMNAILTIILIHAGASFHIIKSISAFVFVLRPICFKAYVDKNYDIVHNVEPDNFTLTQRWSGMAHHIAWFLHSNTDIVIITIFGVLSEVSIYSVYYMVANGMTKIAGALISGAEAMFGNMLASKGGEVTRNRFVYYSMFMNSIVIILFSTAAVMLMPFIHLYTVHFIDADYNVPLLGFLLLLAESLYCVREPYHSIVTAAGHFRRTQTSAILEAAINIVLSLIFINLFGLPGVAVATAIAMLYRTVYYIWYLSKNILKISFIKNCICVSGAIVIIIIITLIKYMIFGFRVSGYLQWFFQTCIYFFIGCVVSIFYNQIFYRHEFESIMNKLRRRFRI